MTLNIVEVSVFTVSGIWNASMSTHSLALIKPLQMLHVPGPTSLMGRSERKLGQPEILWKTGYE